MSARYSAHQLLSGQCGPAEQQAIIQLLARYFVGSQCVDVSSASMLYSCDNLDVFVVRDRHSHGQPIVGMLTMIKEPLFIGRCATIKFPAVDEKHKEASRQLFAQALDFAKKHNITEVGVHYGVRGVVWPHKKLLSELGFVEDGVHNYRLILQ